jgi:hypothetical protein
MNDVVFKVGKVATGVVAAVIVGELVAIGCNAAVDDAEYLIKQAKDKFSPEPVQPKGFFRKK